MRSFRSISIMRQTRQHQVHCALCTLSNTHHGEQVAPQICNEMKCVVPSGDLFETGPVATQGHHHWTGHAKPALLQPQLTHTAGQGWGWHGWSPGHLNWAEPGTPCGKTKERKVVMDCNKLVGSETSPLTSMTCTGYVQIKSETLRVRQNSYRGSLDQIKVLEKRKPSCRVWYSMCRWGDASLPAGTVGIHPSSLPPSCQGLSQSLQTSLLSLGGLEGGLGSAGSPTAKNNQPLPICDRNRRKHIVKFREGLMAISPNPFVFWH